MTYNYQKNRLLLSIMALRDINYKAKMNFFYSNVEYGTEMTAPRVIFESTLSHSLPSSCDR